MALSKRDKTKIAIGVGAGLILVAIVHGRARAATRPGQPAPSPIQSIADAAKKLGAAIGGAITGTPAPSGGAILLPRVRRDDRGCIDEGLKPPAYVTDNLCRICEDLDKLPVSQLEAHPNFLRCYFPAAR